MKLGALVIDTPNALLLAEFYQKLLGWKLEIQEYEDEKWVILKSENSTDLPLVFQEEENFIAPKWPTKKNSFQQMMHLDFYVSKATYQEEIDYALSLGASISKTQFTDLWKVMLDPVGHPFCIIPLPE